MNNFDLDKFKRILGLRELFLKMILPLKFPIILNIEPTNRCNLSCTICPRRFSIRKIVDMDWQIFEKIAVEVARNGPILKIFLQKDGEPLLFPKIGEMVSCLKSLNAAKNVSIISNGTMLNPDLFISLSKAGLDDLIISIDAVEPNSYFGLKGRDCFDQVRRNFLEAAKLKKEMRLTNPRLKARMVERKGRGAETEEFRKIWYSVADAVDITPYHTWMDSVNDYRVYETNKERYPCSLLWYTGIINSDQTVSPCCIDYDCKGVLGKIDSGGFSAIWNGKNLRKLRMRHLLEEYSRTKICEYCQYWLIKENLKCWLKRKYRVKW
ncbi:MAG: radical SAM protein [Candidatus Riflebacteria bacterium]|nr:radical SAM protein [Candidatus Riflebacteria bacterium]